MTVYINPKFGNDSTAMIDDTREHPFKTHKAAIDAAEAYKAQHPDSVVRIVETHKPLK